MLSMTRGITDWVTKSGTWEIFGSAWTWDEFARNNTANKNDKNSVFLKQLNVDAMLLLLEDDVMRRRIYLLKMDSKIVVASALPPADWAVIRYKLGSGMLNVSDSKLSKGSGIGGSSTMKK